MSASELGQVLINVVANSAQAIGARGAGTGHVSITAHEGQGTLELKVRDDGAPPPADANPLGIGQCQRMLATAGGQLRIESKPGIGTVVTITLPTAA